MVTEFVSRIYARDTDNDVEIWIEPDQNDVVIGFGRIDDSAYQIRLAAGDAVIFAAHLKQMALRNQLPNHADTDPYPDF